MGLHNKFPSYFYKRGNLFNTYLGGGTSTPESRKGRDVIRKAVRPSATRLPAPRDAQRAPSAPNPNLALADFVMIHLHDSAAETFVQRICEANGIAIRRSTNDPLAARELCGKLTREKAERYLTALRSRQARGLPLVR